jgi:CHAT domain-containing protein/tetratricopeptide (TPR) repeat protein
MRPPVLMVRLWFAVALATCLSSAGGAMTPLEVDRLFSAIGVRPSDGWLSTSYAHHPRATDTAAREVTSLPPSVLRRYGRLAQLGTGPRTEVRLLRAAAAELALGNIEAAEARVSEALGAPRPSWAAWNDLAVVYLAWADRRPDYAAQAAARAIDAAMRANIDHPDIPQPRFNLARALLRSSLRSQHLAAVDRLRALGRHADWLAELSLPTRQEDTGAAGWDTIRASWLDPHAQRSDASADVARFPGQARDSLLLDLLPAWAQAMVGGRHVEAEALGHRVKSIADAVAGLDGDSVFIDCALALSGSIRDAPGLTRKLADAQGAYSAGRRLYAGNRRDEARAQFQAAASVWRTHAHPCEDWAVLELAAGDAQLGKTREAIDVYRAVAARAAERKYWSLEARASWLSGVALMAQGQAEAAQNAYQRAINIYERAGDAWNLISVGNTAASGLRELGAHQVGWRFLSTALREIYRIPEPLRRYLVFYNTSLYAADAGWPFAAFAFQEAALEQAHVRGAANTIVEALIQRGRRHLDLGRWDRAERDLEEAAQKLPAIASPSSAAYEAAWLARVRADLAVVRRPEDALRLIDPPLIAYFAKREAVEVPSLFHTRARAAIAAGRFAEAADDLTQGLSTFESIYRHLANPELRTSFLDMSWGLFEELIGLRALRQGRADDAFTAAERARAQSHAEPGPTVLPSDISSLLPPGVGVLYFTSLSDRLLVWRLSAGHQEFATFDIGRSELGRFVSAYRRVIQAGGDRADLDRVARPLTEALVDWSWFERRRIASLIIVPDGALHGLPFAALVDSSTGRFLLEATTVSVTTSAAALLTRRAESTANAGPLRFLAIAPPVPAGLDPLPGVTPEIAAIAAHYTSPEILDGPGATAAAVARQIGDHDVIHFAGHAAADLTFPWSSYLALAPDARHPSGRIRLAEIAQWRLPPAQLIVLGACETAIGSVFRGDGVVSLARPFLAAGARTVVGSLWNIDDRAAHLALTRLHANFVASRNSADALRAAQLALVGSADPTDRLPRSWAGFVAVASGR